MFIGEGPGATEDKQGRPFVGRSGALLERLIAEEFGLTRKQVFIANTVKCRPPNNRDPAADEIAACKDFLDNQIRLVSPQVIVILGRIAAHALLSTKVSLAGLRKQTHSLNGIPVFVTYHPSAALRQGSSVVTEMRVDFAKAKLALFNLLEE
jgi:DNA polymerase